MESITIFEISDEKVLMIVNIALIIMILYGWFRKKPLLLAVAIAFPIYYYGSGWRGLIPNPVIDKVLGIAFAIFIYFLLKKMYLFFSEKFTSGI